MLHPFRKTIDELEIGESIITGKRKVSLEDIEHFAEFSGDRFYAHMDEAAAKANPFSKAGWHTATSSSLRRRGCSSILHRVRCSPTTVWSIPPPLNPVVFYLLRFLKG